MKRCILLISILLFSVVVICFPVRASNPAQTWCILLAGRDFDFGNGREWLRNTYYAYWILRYRFGILDDHIRYLYNDYPLSINDSVDGRSDLTSVRATVRDWLGNNRLGICSAIPT